MKNRIARSALFLSFSMLAGLFPVGISPAAAQAFTPAQPLHFGASALVGGGFQNVLALRDGLAVAGADVSGFHRSTDGGATWVPQNAGLEAAQALDLGIASVAFDRANPSTLFACGLRGFYASTDGAQSWTLRATGAAAPSCSPGNAFRFTTSLPALHPRSTGNLIAQDGATLYVGSFDEGIWRSRDAGASWSVIGLAPTTSGDGSVQTTFTRAVIPGPSGSDSVYVGTRGAGAWVITAASTDAPVLTALAGSPANVEEMVFVGPTLYAAAGTAGVYASDDGGASWSPRNNGVDLDSTVEWQSIDGYIDAVGAAILYAGCANCAGARTSYRSLLKSTNGGATWVSVTSDPTRVHATVGGPAGSPWWQKAANPQAFLGQRTFVTSQIVVDPADRQRVYVVGRGAVWKSTNGGSDWYPMVQGLGVTISRAIAVDPKNPQRVELGTSDWDSFSSSDGLRTVVNNDFVPVNMGSSVVIDPYDSTRYLAVGDREDPSIEGALLSRASSATAWTREGYDTVSRNRPIAVTVGRDAAGQRVLLVAVQDLGVLRRVGTGPWATVAAPAPGPVTGPQATKSASFAWTAGSPTVFLYDRAVGVWRSSDFGATWSQIWQHASDTEHTGYVATVPDDPEAVYVSSADGLYRLTGAATGESVEAGTIAADVLADVPRPGAMTVARQSRSWTVFVTSRSGVAPYAPPALLRSADHGATWTDVADDFYRQVALLPHGVAVGSDGTTYVTLGGNGVIVGSPSSPALALTIASVTSPVSAATADAVAASGMTAPGATVVLDATDGGATTSTASALADGAGRWSVSGLDVSGLADGTIVLQATAFDGAGNATDATVNALKDTRPPDGRITQAPPASTSATAATFSFVSSESGSTFRCSLDAQPAAACTSPTTRPVAAGSHTFAVTATDAAGNIDPVPATASWTVTSAATVSIAVKDFSYTPATLTKPQGTSLQWRFDGGTHTASDGSGMGLFDSGSRTSGVFSYAFSAAGTYPFNCTIHPDKMKGVGRFPVKVTPATGNTSTAFTITGAASALASGFVLDVQVKRPNSSRFVAWKTAMATPSAAFSPDAGNGTYSFRARLRNPSRAKASGWSPAAAISVT